VSVAIHDDSAEALNLLLRESPKAQRTIIDWSEVPAADLEDFLGPLVGELKRQRAAGGRVDVVGSPPAGGLAKRVRTYGSLDQALNDEPGGGLSGVREPRQPTPGSGNAHMTAD